MNRNRKETKRRNQVLRIWTVAEARAALPYIASIVRSLREHWFEAQAHRRALGRLEGRNGRPDRANLIAQQEETRAAREAEVHYQHALEELHALDVYCLDPNRGEVLIPFVQDKQLAWYVYDLFDADGLRFWRFHGDSLETRRPIAEEWKDSSGQTRVV